MRAVNKIFLQRSFRRAVLFLLLLCALVFAGVVLRQKLHQPKVQTLPSSTQCFGEFLTSNVCLFRLHLYGRITNAICDLPDVPLRIIETVFNPATTIFYGISPVSQVRSIDIHIYHQYALWLNYSKTVGVLTLDRFATP